MQIPSGVQGACSEGWHVPSDSEWMELEAYLGMPKQFRELGGWRGTNMEGARLLDTNYSGLSNGNCTGLSILNSGRIIKKGRNELTGIEVALTGFYLTSTSYEEKKMWGRKFKHDLNKIERLTFIKHDENGYSCRCAKD